jgi:chromosome segregation ATPase
VTQGRGIVKPTERSSLTLGTELTSALAEYQKASGVRLNISRICRDALWQLVRGQGLQTQVEELRHKIEELEGRVVCLAEQVRNREQCIRHLEQQQKELRGRLYRIGAIANGE